MKVGDRMTQREDGTTEIERSPPGKAGLTDTEGSLLALVLRRQPVTAYQLLRIYEQSPVSSFNESKGSIYPLIRRLKGRGLMAAQPVAGDGRGTEMLHITTAGEDAVRDWVTQIRPVDIIPDDALRTKAISLELLEPDARFAWIGTARARTKAKIAEIEAHMIGLDTPFQETIAASALGALHARLDWLDRLAEVVLDAPA